MPPSPTAPTFRLAKFAYSEMDKRELAIRALMLAITAPTEKQAQHCTRMAARFCLGMTEAEEEEIKQETLKRLDEVTA
jgi:hypothetical protein